MTLEVSGNVAQNRIIVIPGANLCVNQEDFAWLEASNHEFDMVLVQLKIPVEINRMVAR